MSGLMLKQALALAGLGLRVLPLFHIKSDGTCSCNLTECAGAGKHPRLSRWQHRATTDEATIKEWWAKAPLCGVGIATGPGSGIWVLDVDARHDGLESLADLQQTHGDLPPTPTVITGGGGLHLYFALPEGVEIKNRVGIAPGIDVRGTGGYVVGPGSMHASGRTYEWELSSDDLEGPAVAPKWLLDLVAAPSRVSGGMRQKVKAGRDITENRNVALFELGCALRNDGFEEPGIRAALMAENDARCQPPLGDYEVFKIAQSCAMYERGSPKRAVAELEAFNEISKWSKERPPLARNSEVVIGRELLAELADQDGERPIFTEGDLYSYDSACGAWTARADQELEHLVQRYEGRQYVAGHGKTGEPITKPLSLSHNKVKGSVRCAQADVIDVAFFEDAEPGVAVANGFLKVGTEGAHLRRHDASHRARHRVPYEYTKASKAHRWTQFLIEVFEGEECEQKAMLLQEFAGAILVPGLASMHQKCLVLHGSGANGKSQAMEVIAALVPPELRSAVPPQRFTQDYSVATLRGIMLNAAGEIPDADVGGSDRFKSVIAGEPIQARRPYKDAFTFRPQAAHLFSCNQLPGTLDQTRGYWRRFMVIAFENSFTGKQAEEGLAARIIRDELPGVARWAVDGAVRLMKNGAYTMPKSSIEAVEDWRKSSDQVSQWVEDQAKPALAIAGSDEQGTAPRILYNDYSEWASDTGHRRLSLMKFCQRLQGLGFQQIRTRSSRLYPLQLRGLGNKPYDWKSYKTKEKG